MAKRDDNAGLPLSQTLLLKEQLTKVEDQLHQLLARIVIWVCALTSNGYGSKGKM